MIFFCFDFNQENFELVFALNVMRRNINFLILSIWRGNLGSEFKKKYYTLAVMYVILTEKVAHFNHFCNLSILYFLSFLSIFDHCENLLSLTKCFSCFFIICHSIYFRFYFQMLLEMLIYYGWFLKKKKDKEKLARISQNRNPKMTTKNNKI